MKEGRSDYRSEARQRLFGLELEPDSGDDDLGFFARGAVIGAKIKAWFLGFDPSQYQRPAAFGARRSEGIDKLELQRIGHGAPFSAFVGPIASHFRSAE